MKIKLSKFIIALIFTIFIFYPSRVLAEWNGITSTPNPTNNGLNWQFDVYSSGSYTGNINIGFVVIWCKFTIGADCNDSGPNISSDAIGAVYANSNYAQNVSVPSSIGNFYSSGVITIDPSSVYPQYTYPCGRLQADVITDNGSFIGGSMYNTGVNCVEPTPIISPTPGQITPTGPGETPTGSLTPNPTNRITPTVGTPTPPGGGTPGVTPGVTSGVTPGEGSPTLTPSVTPSTSVTPSPSGAVNPTAKPSPTPSRVIVSLTPTPIFSIDKCKCEGMGAPSTIAAGAPTTFTAFTYVNGIDASVAKVGSVTFHFGVQKNPQLDPNLFEELPVSDPISPANLIRQDLTGTKHYRSDWNFTIPADAQPGKIYRVWTSINCLKNNITAMSNSGKTVLASETQQNSGFFAGIFDAFRSFFAEGFSITSKQSLQLNTFSPALEIQKFCQSVQFKF